MPIYEYYCEDCDFKFELLKSIKENQSAECPKCNKLAKRQVSLPGGLVFKGSGFYITDYAKKSDKDSTITEKSKKETPISNNTTTKENQTSVANDKNSK
jgi:putative FmdB family regulatory protein